MDPIKIINLRAPIKIITVASNLVQLRPLHLSRAWFYSQTLEKYLTFLRFKVHRLLLIGEKLFRERNYPLKDDIDYFTDKVTLTLFLNVRPIIQD